MSSNVITNGGSEFLWKPDGMKLQQFGHQRNSKPSRVQNALNTARKNPNKQLNIYRCLSSHLNSSIERRSLCCIEKPHYCMSVIGIKRGCYLFVIFVKMDIVFYIDIKIKSGSWGTRKNKYKITDFSVKLQIF